MAWEEEDKSCHAAGRLKLAPENSTHKSPEVVQPIPWLIVSFRQICVWTAALPMVTLAFCFVTAYIFQAEAIHETHCKVYNIIPSISAITGVSPQRYLWRICIALHIGPRIAIALVYRNYYRSIVAQFVPVLAKNQPRINLLMKTVFALHLIEIFALCCVSYVSNRENYRKWNLIARKRILIPFVFLFSCPREILHLFHDNVSTAHAADNSFSAVLKPPQTSHRRTPAIVVVEEDVVHCLIG